MASSLTHHGGLLRESIGAVFLLVLLIATSQAEGPTTETFKSQSTVGLPVAIKQLVLPGGELEPVPWDDSTLVVLKIEAVFPHGTAFRYDFSYQGLEPGEYDLRKFLKRKDGSSTADLPALPVTIKSLLPPGQIAPHEVAFGPLPWLGGYRTLLTVLTLLWLAGLAWIIYPRRGRNTNTTADSTRPQSLAERLRPLVTRAMQGDVSTAELAELERALEGYWRRRLKLGNLPPAAAIAQLRQHPEAGPLVSQLESWLHRPPDGKQVVDVHALLSPYRNLPADALESDTLTPAGAI
jgi:hypothetical protein